MIQDEIVSEEALSKFFDRKQSKDNHHHSCWRTVDYIQTCVKGESGVGKQILVYFAAEIVNGRCCYRHEHFANELELLREGMFMEFA